MSSEEPLRYSHPPDDTGGGTLLDDHLFDTGSRAAYVVPEGATTATDEPIWEVTRRVAIVHDFGKSTTYFQQHIDVEDGDPDRDVLSHHSPIGALVAYYALDVAGYEDETCLAGFVAVAKHHGQLPDAAGYVHGRVTWWDDESNRKLNAVSRQVQDIDEHVPDLADEIVREATDGAGSWTEFVEEVAPPEANRAGDLFERLKAQVGTGIQNGRVDPRAVSEGFYATVLQVWSALVLADKTSAADAPGNGSAYDPTVPSVDRLQDHVSDLQDGIEQLDDRERALNEKRQEAHDDVVENVDSFVDSDSHVATLTLPTGLGKTLTGLRAAMRTRDLTDSDRVVYAIPFTSIVDQVADEITDIYPTDGTDDRLTIHHHLAETAIELDENGTDENARVEEMLGESWRSGITVTTFVQLFESLAGPKNTQSMKLPALYDSVVVLDEPQSLPHSWWRLVDRLVEILTEEYGATVIAMTATQPRLFTVDGDRPPELVDDHERYFENLDRVEYAVHESVANFGDDDATVTHDDAAETLVGAVHSAGSVLSVCNTIDSAEQLTEAVASRTTPVDVGEIYCRHLERAGTADEVAVEDIVDDVRRNVDENGIALLHFSTRLRPCDRLTLLDATKSLTDGGTPLIAISTQLIEAGVDVSFGRVYRDFAPMDSIVQAAGRCNRSFEWDRGRVTVWWLEPPDGKETTPGVAVYETWGDSLLSVTTRALNSIRESGELVLPEATMSCEGVQEYYELLHRRKPGDETPVEHVDRCQAEALSEVSLIDSRRSFEVVVTRTEDERETVEAINDAFSNRDYDTADQLLEKTRRMQVSIPLYSDDSEEAKLLRDLPPLGDTDLLHLDARAKRGQFADYFDDTTGLVVTDSVENRFL